MASWPFVARTAELGEGCAALRDGSQYRGVVIRGEAGAGKTALARVLADELESDSHTVRFVLGTETGRAVPLGAFNHALSVDEAREPATMLAAAYRALAGVEALALVVDDAAHLDPLSALLVQQLAMNASAKVILTLRCGESAPDALAALWKDDLLHPIVLEPFDRTQSGKLLCGALGGDVEEQTVDQLHRLSSGNPLYLRSLLTAALGDGVLARADNGWSLHGQLGIGSDLTELMESRLKALTAAELDVVEIVSIAEVVDWDVIRTLCAADHIVAAERAGAVKVVDDGAHPLVRPGHPLIGEAVRRRCGVARTRQVNTLLTESMQDAMRRRSGRSGAPGPDVRAAIQLARFMIRSDATPHLDLLVAAAESAVTMANLELGEQLSRFAYEHGGGLAAAVVLADSMSWQGRGAEAEALLSTFDPDGVDEFAIVRWGSLRAANLFFGCGQVAAAHRVLDTVHERATGGASRDLVTAMQTSFAFFSADLATALRIGLPALDTDMQPTASVWTAMATAGALALSGRFGEVPDVADKGTRAADRCESGPQRYAIALAEVLACTSAGELAEADRVCERYARTTGGVPQAEAILSALAGRVALACGQLGPACEALETSLWTMAESLPPGWVMLVAAWLAQAESARGCEGAAAAALSRAEEAYGPQVEVFHHELHLARAWVQAAAGQTTTARRHAATAAQHARRTGMAAAEALALHTTVRFGDRSAAARLSQLAEMLDCRLTSAMAAHARGLGEHDGARLDDAADRFEEVGALALAADASAHAAREHARSGTRLRELESSTRAHWLASRSGLRDPAVRLIDTPLPITDREREIANLVGAGLTNREIADRLFLSVRTIDGHLYRIFSKLGIRDRDQLARLVRFRPAT